MSRFVVPLGSESVLPGPVPTFSVVIAAYEAAATIAEAVASALDQVPPPLEVIVADDGSTDDIAQALAPFEDRVTLLKGEHLGIASARNAGTNAARGEFVVFLDADDVFLPGRMDALGRLAAEHPDLDLLTTDANLTLGGRFIGRCYHAGNRFAIRDQRLAILERNFVFGLAAARRARLLAIGGHDEAILTACDWACWINLVLDGARVGLVDEPLAEYRLSESATSASRLGKYRGRVQTLTMARNHPTLTPAEREVVELSLAREECRVAREELDDAVAGGDARARRIARGVLADPRQPLKNRVKASVAFVLPVLVGLSVRRERRRGWVTVGDLRVPRRSAD